MATNITDTMYGIQKMSDNKDKNNNNKNNNNNNCLKKNVWWFQNFDDDDPEKIDIGNLKDDDDDDDDDSCCVKGHSKKTTYENHKNHKQRIYVYRGGIVDPSDKPNIVHVVIDNDVTTIESMAFDGCHSLRCIKFLHKDNYHRQRYQFRSIQSYAFSGCSSLTTIINLPTTIRSIESYAFYGCNALSSSSIIPVLERCNSLVHIGQSVFEGCQQFILDDDEWGIGDVDDDDGPYFDFSQHMTERNGQENNNTKSSSSIGSCDEKNNEKGKGKESKSLDSRYLQYLCDVNRSGINRILFPTNDDNHDTKQNFDDMIFINDEDNKMENETHQKQKQQKQKRRSHHDPFPPSLWSRFLYRLWAPSPASSSSMLFPNEKSLSPSLRLLPPPRASMICWHNPKEVGYLNNRVIRSASIVFHFLVNGGGEMVGRIRRQQQQQQHHDKNEDGEVHVQKRARTINIEGSDKGRTITIKSNKMPPTSQQPINVGRNKSFVMLQKNRNNGNNAVRERFKKSHHQDGKQYAQDRFQFNDDNDNHKNHSNDDYHSAMISLQQKTHPSHHEQQQKEEDNNLPRSTTTAATTSEFFPFFSSRPHKKRHPKQPSF